MKPSARDMSAPTEPVDPDFHLHTAWLAQVSEPAGAPVNKQAPSQGGSSTSASTSSLELVDRVVEQDDALTLGSGLLPPKDFGIGRGEGHICVKNRRSS
jgi:hypothetical protein